MAAGEVIDSANIATEITLAAEPQLPLEETKPDERALPFSFAKRHGVLICEFVDGVGDTIYRKGVSPLILAEARRFAGLPLKMSAVSNEKFDAMLVRFQDAGGKPDPFGERGRVPAAGAQTHGLRAAGPVP